MKYDEVAVEQKERVRFVFMNRPDKRNALNERMTRELISALEEADADPSVGAVVLAGKGEAFCAGADLGYMASAMSKTAPVLYQEGAAGTVLFKMGLKMTKPLIAAVDGHALAGGCGLVAMCHLAVASERAKFGAPEIKVGLFPFVIFPLLARAVGPRRALEMSLTGRLMSAAEAAEIGLVNMVLPVEEFEAGVMKLASKIADRSPLVLRLGLNAYNTSMDMEINKAMDYLSTIRVINFLSEELKEGAMAFIQKKRTPK